MRPSFRHIIIVMSLMLCMTSCHRPKGVIPRDTMAKIYADMIVADQWISIQSAEIRRQSDTTQFYEPIFNKYGYTLSDYLTSVNYYMIDPDRFSRILKKTESILEAVKERDEAILGTGNDADEQDEDYVPEDAYESPDDDVPIPASRREMRSIKKKKGRP